MIGTESAERTVRAERAERIERTERTERCCQVAVETFCLAARKAYAVAKGASQKKLRGNGLTALTGAVNFNATRAPCQSEFGIGPGWALSHLG